MEHTKGPWIITGESEGGRYITVKGATGRTVARVPWSSPKEGEDMVATDDGDAKLIAAAPELLRAANALLDNARDMGECFDDDGNMHGDYLALDQAIDKAEGKR